MPYVLGRKSLANLEGVHDDLVKVVKRAIELTEQDFAVHEGLRSAERQRALYNKGLSKLDGFMNFSRHQTGKAVDLVPYVDGVLAWEWEAIFPVADAVRKAAVEWNVPIRWGGTWQEFTNERYSGFTAKEMFETNPSWDGAHFELPKRVYS